MKVHVRFFSRLKDVTGVETAEAELRDGATANDLLELLHERHPGLREWDAHLLVAVGLEYAGRDHALREGDEVSIMPPVQGG